MSTLHKAKDGYSWLSVLAVGLFSLLVILVQLDWPVLILPDERTYSLEATRDHWLDAGLGQYGYSLFYSWVGSTGSDFYLWAKFQNLLFWSISGFAVYGICRHYFHPYISAALACLHLIMPTSFYASSFLPEAMLTMLITLSFLVLFHVYKSGAVKWLPLFPVLLFIASITKAQGSVFALSLAVVATILLITHKDRVSVYVLMSVSGAIGFRGVMGYLTGESAPFLFGSYNNRIPVPFEPERSEFESGGVFVDAALWHQIAESSLIHFAIIAMLAPILIMSLNLGLLRRSPQVLYVLGAFFALSVMAVGYHALTVTNGEPLGTQTLTRYFEGILVLTVSVVVGDNLARNVSPSRVQTLSILSLLSVSGWLFAVLWPMSNQTTANSASADILSTNGWTTAAFIVLAPLILALLSLKKSDLVFSTSLFSSLVVLVGLFVANWNYYAFKAPYDLAGRDIAVITEVQPSAQILVVGPEHHNTLAASFYGLSRNIQQAPTDACIARGSCSVDYVVFLDERLPMSKMQVLVKNDTYSIYRTLD